MYILLKIHLQDLDLSWKSPNVFTSTVYKYLQFGLFVLEKELSNCPSIFRNTPKGKTQTDKFNSSNQIAETFLYHMTMFGKIFFC